MKNGFREFMDLVELRKTVYGFDGRNISQRNLTKILEAGRWAPSSQNCQPWSFIVVKNKKRIGNLMKLCHYGAFHNDPPMIIVFVLEPIYENQKGLLQGKVTEHIISHKYMNIYSPAIHMIYEAVSLGIGSFIASPVVEDANKLLNIPAGKEAILILGLGYGKKGAFQKKSERKKISEIVFNETYGKRT